MKILILGNATWDDTNSVGNTLSNFFGDWDDLELTFIYNRASFPDNNCCRRYYVVSVQDVLKNLFTPWKIGQPFFIDTIKRGSHNTTESKALNQLTGFKRYLAKLFIDLLYATKIWCNRKIKSFIKETNPDVVFLFAISDAFRYNLVKYLKTNTKAKVIEFVADDMYYQYCNDKSLLNRIYKKRYLKMLRMADKLYGASELLCESYNRDFGLDLTPLYKGCKITIPKQTVNNPLKMIYAGNLQWGRDETLFQLVNALELINRNKKLIELSIYSNSYVNEDLRKKLNKCHSAFLHNAIPYEQVKKLMSESDIVLHVESFDKEQIKLVRYSFSTKIVDCLQAGAVMMVIGPSGISSVEFCRQVPGSIVIDDVLSIEKTLKETLKEPLNLHKQALLTNEFAKEYFDIFKVRKNLFNDFEMLIK